MDSLKLIVRKDCYMSSTDLRNAYYSVPVAICDQKYLMFQFAGQLYKFVCLPNGLTSAPRLFTKLLKPIFAVLHKEGHDIMGYLDDSVKLFHSLGFQVHPEKSSLTPKQ